MGTFKILKISIGKRGKWQAMKMKVGDHEEGTVTNPLQWALKRKTGEIALAKSPVISGA
jgi:hypothetical protein